MLFKKWSGVFAVACLAAAAVPSCAQDAEDWPNEVEVMGGFNSSNQLKDAFTGGIRIGGILKKKIGAEVEFTYLESEDDGIFNNFGAPYVVPLSLDGRAAPAKAVVGNADSKRWNLVGSVVGTFEIEPKLLFLIMAGGGFSATRTAVTTLALDECVTEADGVTPCPGDVNLNVGEQWNIASHELKWGTRRAISVHLGVGGRLNISKRYFLRGDIRFRGNTTGDYRNGGEVLFGIGRSIGKD